MMNPAYKAGFFIGWGKGEESTVFGLRSEDGRKESAKGVKGGRDAARQAGGREELGKSGVYRRHNARLLRRGLLAMTFGGGLCE